MREGGGPPIVTAILAMVILGVAWKVTGFLPTEASLAPVAWSRAAWAAQDWGKLVLSVFAHGGPLHLVMNLLALVMVGPALERGVGHAKFLGVFLGAGLAGNLAHAAYETLPVVGASGALFGLIGLLAMLEPRAPIAIFFPIPMPATLAGAVYAAAVPFMMASSAVPIAHIAHLGGMAFGMAASFAVAARRAVRTVGPVVAVFIFVWAGSLLVARVAERVLARAPIPDRELLFFAFVGAVVVAGLALAFRHLERVDAEHAGAW